MVIRRGSIWWANMGLPQGSGPGYRRPVLVVQADDFNRSDIKTTVAVILTTNLRLADAPGNVLLKKEHSGLNKDSVINVSQLITIDKEDLTECVGIIATRYLKKVEKGLKSVLFL